MTLGTGVDPESGSFVIAWVAHYLAHKNASKHSYVGESLQNNYLSIPSAPYTNRVNYIMMLFIYDYEI